MITWLIRAGRVGEREKLALETGTVVRGWEERPDLTPSSTRDESVD